MEKLLPIINTVLSLVALILCVITLLTVNGLKAQVAEMGMQGNGEAKVSADIPLSQQTLYNMDKQFIFTYPPKEGEKKMTNVVVLLLSNLV